MPQIGTRAFEYPMETARGFDDREDPYSPGRFVSKLETGETIAIVASTQAPTEEWESMRNAEIDWRDRISSKGVAHGAVPQGDDITTKQCGIEIERDDFLLGIQYMRAIANKACFSALMCYNLLRRKDWWPQHHSKIMNSQ